MTPHVVVFDGSNLFHRARSGFTLGDHCVTFNFFRSFKALVALLKPTRAIIACDGDPVVRRAIYSEYKSNRPPPDENFVKQRKEIIDLLTAYFPVSIMRHPGHEADDLIYTIIANASSVARFTVVSTDTDFKQLLDDFKNVTLYNPVTKSYQSQSEHSSYLLWKTLRGDATDSVPPIEGFNDTRAQEYASDVDKLNVALDSGKIDRVTFARNYDLIKFIHISVDELNECTSSAPVRDWDAVKRIFEAYDFKSMLKDKYWQTFIATFDTLWPVTT